MAAVRKLKLLAVTAAVLASCAAGRAETSDPIADFLGLADRPARSAHPATRDVEITGAIEPGPDERPAAIEPQAQRPQGAQTAPMRPAAPKPAQAAIDDYPVDLLISLANDAVYTRDPYPKGRRADPRMIKLQVLLDRNNASPGVIDGMFGDNVVKAVRAFEEMRGHPIDGLIDVGLWADLEGAAPEPALISYTITPEDVAGPFVSEMPHDYAEQAALPGLAYRDAAEMLAERFHMDEGFLRRLNPDVTFAEAGVDVVVANVGRPQKAKVASIVADKERKQLRGYDAAGRLVVAYPATIGSSTTPSPTGTHAVKAVAVNPDYWYRPQVNFVQGKNTKALRLPPGPNGPVGATWVGLTKPTYGLHGTPEPSKIDKTNSHGCVRLTNWDARELAGLVQPGVPVEFREPPGVEPIPMAAADPVVPVDAPAAMEAPAAVANPAPQRQLGAPPRNLALPAPELASPSAPVSRTDHTASTRRQLGAPPRALGAEIAPERPAALDPLPPPREVADPHTRRALR